MTKRGWIYLDIIWKWGRSSGSRMVPPATNPKKEEALWEDERWEKKVKVKWEESEIKIFNINL